MSKASEYEAELLRRKLARAMRALDFCGESVDRVARRAARIAIEDIEAMQ